MSRLKVSIKVCPIVQVLRQNCHKIFLQKKDKEKLPDILTFFLSHSQEKSQADTLHFWDGERKIDIVLAFEDDENGPEDIRKAEKRKTFQRNLEEQGLELELEPSHVNRSYI